MSARLTPDELRKIAPDEYARIYGARGSPPKPDDVSEIEADRMEKYLSDNGYAQTDGDVGTNLE